MNDTNLDSPSAIRAFLAETSNLTLKVSKADRYAWVSEKLRATSYIALRKKDKSVVKEYIERVTGLSRAQVTRLISQYKINRCIGKKSIKKNCFPKLYTREDILLLAKTDEAHNTLSGAATKKLFERAFNIFGDEDYVRLKGISISHIYNLRKSRTYQNKRHYFEKTKRTSVKIGERRKPFPNGEPGYIRVDTVHQGDKDKEKGVYHINSVDEVTQFEIICSVEKISERYLIPVLENLIDAFPFIIKGFHADNGSEYINKHVARLLNKLNIELTKSRSRHSNDNALAESKNGAIIRKHLGYEHISQKWAPIMNEFNLDILSPYVNFHRPCYFAETKIDKKGKQRKIYPYKLVMTPYEKLKSLANSDQYLKPGVTFEQLDKMATELNDLEAATQMNKAKSQLFKKIFDT